MEALRDETLQKNHTTYNCAELHYKTTSVSGSIAGARNCYMYCLSFCCLTKRKQVQTCIYVININNKSSQSQSLKTTVICYLIVLQIRRWGTMWLGLIRRWGTVWLGSLLRFSGTEIKVSDSYILIWSSKSSSKLRGLWQNLVPCSSGTKVSTSCWLPAREYLTAPRSCPQVLALVGAPSSRPVTETLSNLHLQEELGPF